MSNTVTTVISRKKTGTVVEFTVFFFLVLLLHVKKNDTASMIHQKRKFVCKSHFDVIKILSET